jgi:hypothetical protein
MKGKLRKFKNVLGTIYYLSPSGTEKPILGIVLSVNNPFVEVLSRPSLNCLSWQRDLIGPKLAKWHNLLPHIANIQLAHEQDEFHWNLHSNGQFSMKSHYQTLLHIDIPNTTKLI